MNGNGRASNYIEGPTSSVRERICAARKQARDARILLEQLLETCSRMRAMLGEKRGAAFLDVEEELHAAIVDVARSARGLDRVQL